MAALVVKVERRLARIAENPPPSIARRQEITGEALATAADKARPASGAVLDD